MDARDIEQVKRMPAGNISQTQAHVETDFVVAGTRSRTASVLLLGALGVFFLFGVGFAHADLMHNAAHDSRHAFTFPCH